MIIDTKIVGREGGLFKEDVQRHETHLTDVVSSSRFLVIGGAGSIGQAVVKEIFKRKARSLHVVDISENNLVELVRDLRSSFGYRTEDFLTFAIDVGSVEFSAMVDHHGPYDYVLNLSAMKHVRSESDPFTLMRLIKTNIFNTVKSFRECNGESLKKYFCVSTDKAANPVNMMGASKRIMELFMTREAMRGSISMARFANVAFSDGSLLHGFNARINKRQPITAPSDVRRYFVTFQESGELCLLSTLLGESLDIFFPKLVPELNLTKFSDIAESFLIERGYQPYACGSEEEARSRVDELLKQKRWPVFFFQSDTTGEKDFEEFYTGTETIDWDGYDSIGVIKSEGSVDPELLRIFSDECSGLIKSGSWSKEQLVYLFTKLLPDFAHSETGKYLDGRM